MTPWWLFDDSMKKWWITKLSYRNLSISWPQIENTGKKGVSTTDLAPQWVEIISSGEFIFSCPTLSKVFYQSMNISIKSHGNAIALD